MSSGLSRKEQEILQRQRAVARQREIVRQQPPPPPKHKHKPPPTNNSRRSHSTSLSQLLGQKAAGKKPRPPPSKPKPMPPVSKKCEVIDLTSPQKSKPASTSTSTSSSKMYAAASKQKQKPQPPILNRPNASNKRPSMKQKRPTKKLLNSTNSNEVDAAILASRSRLKHNGHGVGVSIGVDGEREVSIVSVKAGRNVPGKTMGMGVAMGTSGMGGRLSLLLNKAGVTKNELENTQANPKISWEEEEDRNGTALDMDEYYQNLREWDFLSDWDHERGGGSGNGSGGGNKRKGNGNSSTVKGNANNTSTTTTIPEIFKSRRQYQKLWAPLCLAEMRAQFLSDASSKLPWQSNSNSNSNSNSTSTKNKGQRANTFDDPLVQTGLAQLGDQKRWTAEEMFKTNEKLTGKEVQYDGNPHVFSEKGFQGNDPHAFRVVGGTFMNTSEGLSEKMIDERKQQYQPLVRTEGDSALTPFFSDEGATPWGELVAEAKQDGSNPNPPPSNKKGKKNKKKNNTQQQAAGQALLSKLQTGSSSQGNDDDDDEIDDPSLDVLQMEKLKHQKYLEDQAFIENWVSKLPQPKQYRIHVNLDDLLSKFTTTI